MINFGFRLKKPVHFQVWLGGASRALARPTFLIGLATLLIPLLVILVVSNLKAGVNQIVVNTLGDTTAAGDTKCTLREAINNANSESDTTGGDCAAGTGTDTIVFSVSGTIDIHNNGTLPAIVNTLTIDGTGQTITVDGASMVGVMFVNPGASLTLDDLTIADGSGATNGAGVWNQGTLAVTHSTFANNTAVEMGGGIYNDGGTLSVTNSAFTSNNSTTAGGAAIFNDGGVLTVTSDTFSDNIAYGGGGAIYDHNSTDTITGSTFSDNSADTGAALFVSNKSTITVATTSFIDNNTNPGNGGGIYNNGTVGVITSAFLGNGAADGGAIYNDTKGMMAVSNSTFTDNNADFGGAAFNNGPFLSFTNDTIDGNLAAAANQGAGIYNSGVVVTVTNSILANNSLENCVGGVQNGGYNIADDGSCSFGSITGANGQNLGDNVTNINFDPAGVQNNGGPTQTVALLFNSPAVDAIPIDLCPLTDQRGFPRPDSAGFSNPVAACDVGAYEFSAIVVNSLLDTAVSGDGKCTLREAIDNVNADTDTSGGDCTVANGIAFSVSGQITLGSTLPAVTTAMSIDGSGQNITVDGANLYQVMSVSSTGNLILSNLTVADGSNISGSGGGIANEGKLTVSGCTMSNNQAPSGLGGAIFNDSLAILIVESTTLSGNSSASGSGGAIYSLGKITVRKSLLLNNSANAGGGIFNQGPAKGAVTKPSTVTNGAIGIPAIPISGIANITNNTFAGNSAVTGGGAILNTQGQLESMFNTFWNNSSTANGGAINDTVGSTTVFADIFASSGAAGNCFGNIEGFGIDGDNISDDNTCDFGTLTGANGATLGDNVNPLLDPAGLQDNGGPTKTIALQPNSPAIDSVPLADCLNTDQRGNARPDREDIGNNIFPACDVGAFELTEVPATATATVTPTATPTATPTTAGTATMTATLTPTVAFTATATATAAATSTATPTATATAAPPVITFVAAGPLTDTSAPLTTLTVSVPAGVIAGDVLLAQIVIYDGAGTNVPSPPAGWTVIRHDAVNVGNKMTSWLYFKVAGGSEPISYSWTISSQYGAGVMGAWRGAASAPIDQASGAFAGGANPIAAAAPSLTPFTDSELQVYFYGSQNFAAPTITQPAAITARANDKSTKEGFTLAFGDLSAPTHGTPSQTYSASSAGSGGFPVITAQAVLLIPAGTPATATATATAVQSLTATPTATPPPATPTITPTPVPPTPTATATPFSPVAFVNAGPLFDSSSAVTTVTVSLPSGVVSGDVLLAQLVIYDGLGTNVPSTPAGWTVIRHDTISSGNKMTSWLYYKVAGGSEPASYSWSIASQFAAGVMGAWRGTSAAPFDQASGSSATGNPATDAAPSLTPAHSNELQVYFYGSQNFSAPTIAVPSPIVSRANDRSSKEGFTLAFGDLPAPAQGHASPTYNAGASGSGPVVLTGQAVLLIAGP